MSVRMALVKLAAFTAGGAVIGGGAVHTAEAPAAQTQYVKHAKRTAQTTKTKVKRAPAVRRIAKAGPTKQRKIRRVVTRSYSCEIGRAHV